MGSSRSVRTHRRRRVVLSSATGRAGITSMLLIWIATACGLTTPLYLESQYAIPTTPTATVQVVVATPVDLRPFSAASNRAPVPSVQGDPADAALTARVVGRRLNGLQMLGPNILLPPGESVSLWVGRAVVEGLRAAGVPAVLAASGPNRAALGRPEPSSLRVSIHEFWLDLKPSAGLPTIEYRVEIALQGSVAGFREAAGATAQGGVSAGGLDMTLWRRSFDRALDEIASKTAELADPLGPRPRR